MSCKFNNRRCDRFFREPSLEDQGVAIIEAFRRQRIVLLPTSKGNDVSILFCHLESSKNDFLILRPKVADSVRVSSCTPRKCLQQMSVLTATIKGRNHQQNFLCAFSGPAGVNIRTGEAPKKGVDCRTGIVIFM